MRLSKMLLIIVLLALLFSWSNILKATELPLVGVLPVETSYRDITFDGTYLWGLSSYSYLGAFVYKIDPSNGHTIKSFKLDFDIGGLINSIAYGDGNLWFYSYPYVFKTDLEGKIDWGSLQVVLLGNGMIFHNGHLWIAEYDTVCEYEPHSFSKLREIKVSEEIDDIEFVNSNLYALRDYYSTGGFARIVKIDTSTGTTLGEWRIKEEAMGITYDGQFLCVSVFFEENLYKYDLSGLGGDVIPDIKVNGSDGPITLNQSDTARVTLTVNNDGRADNADWWLAADTPSGLYFFTFEGWTENWQPGHQGPLFYLDSFEVLNGILDAVFPTSTLGTYTLYFGVDTVMDGNVTWDSLYYDTVVFNVEAVDVTGTWVGTYSTSLIPLAQTTFTLTQSGAYVTGSYSTSTGVFGTANGTFSGTVSGNTIMFTLDQTTSRCEGSFSGTATVSNNAMSFTFEGFDCLGYHANGQGNATKQ